MSSRNVYVLTLVTTLALAVSACSQKTDYQMVDQNKPAKAHNHAAAWSYEGSTAPEYWGDIEGNQTCKIGKEQSPINIARVTPNSADAPVLNYDSSSIAIKDNGHAVVYTPSSTTNTMMLNGDSYTLKQMHYHMPSEHQISGQNFAGELHFVHANQAGNLAVVGVMVQAYQSSPLLKKLIEGSRLAVSSHKDVVVDDVNLAELLPKESSYYHYVGSLTTPPCSEKVKWFVMERPLYASPKQIEMMSTLYSGNNRPVQPQGNRRVLKLAP